MKFKVEVSKSKYDSHKFEVKVKVFRIRSMKHIHSKSVLSGVVWSGMASGLPFDIFWKLARNEMLVNNKNSYWLKKYKCTAWKHINLANSASSLDRADGRRDGLKWVFVMYCEIQYDLNRGVWDFHWFVSRILSLLFRIFDREPLSLSVNDSKMSRYTQIYILAKLPYRIGF